MKIKELYSDKSKWTQGTLSRDVNGKPTAHTCCATCWCLIGAAYYCYRDLFTLESALNKIKNELHTNEHTQDIASWNDNPNRTFKEVKALVNKLDI